MSPTDSDQVHSANDNELEKNNTEYNHPEDNLDLVATTEEEFNRLCSLIKEPIEIEAKLLLRCYSTWNKRDRLQFYHSLAFILRSDEIIRIAVSSFIDHQDQNKLYIASQDPMTEIQKHQITEILQMLLDMKPWPETLFKILPRHMSNIFKHFCEAAVYRKLFIKVCPGDLANKIYELANKMHSGKELEETDFIDLLSLIRDNRTVVLAIRNDFRRENKYNSHTAHHLFKILKIVDELYYVWKQIKRHQKDPDVESLSQDFEFISFDCHPELALLKVAKDHCKSKTLYIGLSKRPCYCCGLLFKAIQKNKSTDFNISIIRHNIKLYGMWPKLDCFQEEFQLVWKQVNKEIHQSRLLEPFDEYVRDENFRFFKD